MNTNPFQACLWWLQMYFNVSKAASAAEMPPVLVTLPFTATYNNCQSMFGTPKQFNAYVFFCNNWESWYI